MLTLRENTNYFLYLSGAVTRNTDLIAESEQYLESEEYKVQSCRRYLNDPPAPTTL